MARTTQGLSADGSATTTTTTRQNGEVELTVEGSAVNAERDGDET